MNSTVEAMLTRTADRVLGSRPRRRPSRKRLAKARIVSHRGEHDGAKVRENTIPAFDAAVAAGVWGLELDVRYSADGEPVISHDADLSRVFDNPSVIARTAWANLHNRASSLLHLEEFLARYGGHAHLMIELKARSPGIGEARMLRLLDAFEPVADYHILALDTSLFAAVRELPNRCRLPVARFNHRQLLDYTLTRGCAGLAGHYAMLGLESVLELQAGGRRIGTGFIPSRNLLWREINRGVDWIFSNQAVRLQDFLDEAATVNDNQTAPPALPTSRR